MAESLIINNQELAILCDLMGGWGAKWGEKLDDSKRQALDHLIANGFVEPADEKSLTTYNYTAKASLLLSELCVGISGG
jgi:hypothetical protein